VHVVVLAERHVEVHRRDRRDHAGVAAIAAGDRGAVGVGGGVGLELGREADGADVGLEQATVQLAHAGRVVGDDRGIVRGAARTCEGAAKTLGAVFLQLEGGAVGLANGEYAGNADGQQGGAAESGSGRHKVVLSG